MGIYGNIPQFVMHCPSEGNLNKCLIFHYCKQSISEDPFIYRFAEILRTSDYKACALPTISN